jgi:hypothetical protein
MKMKMTTTSIPDGGGNARRPEVLSQVRADMLR